MSEGFFLGFFLFFVTEKWKTIINSKRWKILTSARVQAQQKGNFLPSKYAANRLITRLRGLWPGSKDGRCITLVIRGLSTSPGHECCKKMPRMVLGVLKATQLYEI